MAVYKVPQDVEADDKLIGPFSFRQFIYLIIVAAGIAIGWVLSQIFIGLAIIPLPIILFFGALALPLRKDQPMETYLAAIVSFYIKPRKRMWDPDGQQALVQITAPKKVEEHLTKDLSEDETERRLAYLANVVDSRGWAVRGVVNAPMQINPAMDARLYNEAQTAQDMLDSATAEYSSIDNRLDQANARHHQELVNRMQRPITGAAAVATTLPANDPQLSYNPYPVSMQQSVIQPVGAQPIAPQQQLQPTPEPPKQTSSANPPSPGIINLANNPDLTIETIAHEANRLKEKEGLPKDEVTISLH